MKTRSPNRNQRLKDLEMDMKDKFPIQKVHNLSHFPYNSLSEVKVAIKANELSVGVEYNADFMEYYSTRGLYFIHTIFTFMPYIAAFACVFVTIFTKQWMILAGIPLAFLGQLSSSPYFWFKGTVRGLGGIIFIVSFFIGWKWIVISGALFIPLFFTMVAREQYSQLMKDIAFRSEFLFCYFFMHKAILLKDPKQNKIIWPHVPTHKQVQDKYFTKQKVFNVDKLWFLCIKNQSLEDRYPGGVLNFVDKYGITFNKKISIVPNAHRKTLLKLKMELAEYEIGEPEDYISRIYYPDDLNCPPYPEYYPSDSLEFPNDWLTGGHNAGTFYVFHV